MKRILITGAGNLRNNGIYAMVVGVYQGFLQKNCSTKFYMLSARKKEDEDILQNTNITVLEKHWFLRRKNKFFFAFGVFEDIFLLALGRFFNIKSKQQSLNVYKTCDLVIDLSGDSISSDYGNYSLFFALYEIFLGIVAKRKVILLGQTLGPFKGKLTRLITKYILKRTDKIVLREEKSKEYLDKIGFSHNNIVLSGDNAFLLEPDFDSAKKVLSKENIVLDDSKLIGFSPSCLIYNWFKDPLSSEDKQKEYLRQLSLLIDSLIMKYHYKIVFIPHVVLPYGDDSKICREIYNNVKNKDMVHLIENYYNGSVLKAIMSRLHFMIAFRMHAAINALSIGVPTACWAYNYKFQGIIGKKLGLSKYIIDIRECTLKQGVEKLESVVDNLNKDRQATKILIDKNVLKEKEKAMQNIEMALELLNQNSQNT
ncbi:MAG: polysaccharide pyruvyl transferase family protein [Candidatus Aureabacteria bacterium]|nr:polysaccharide pyruvyl transferase family protein [Candidatus Auribacterota bacterium]